MRNVQNVHGAEYLSYLTSGCHMVNVFKFVRKLIIVMFPWTWTGTPFAYRRVSWTVREEQTETMMM